MVRVLAEALRGMRGSVKKSHTSPIIASTFSTEARRWYALTPRRASVFESSIMSFTRIAPDALISSLASVIAFRAGSPNPAPAPERGRIAPTTISFGAAEAVEERVHVTIERIKDRIGVSFIKGEFLRQSKYGYVPAISVSLHGVYLAPYTLCSFAIWLRSAFSPCARA
jgi:hypothetical protein